MPKDLTPQKILNMLLRHIKLIVLVALLTTLLTYGYSKFFINPTYTSSALMLVQNYDDDITQPTTAYSNGNRANIGDITASATLAKQCVVLFKNSPDMTGLMSGAYITIGQVDDSNFLRISATSNNAQNSANIVNKLVEQAPKCFSNYYDNRGKVSKITEAYPPSFPSSPNVKQITLYGLGIGVVLGMLLAFFIEIIDSTVKAGDDLSKMYNIPVLAEVIDFEQEA